MKKLLAVRELLLLLMVLVLGAILSLASPHFLTPGNILTLLINNLPEFLCAIGMTILIVSGGFDLSVGSVLALAAVMGGWVMSLMAGQPAALVVLTGVAVSLAVGAAFGVFNGVVVTKARVNPLIATLGTMLVARSLVLVKTSSYSVDFPQAFKEFSKLALFGRINGFVIIILIAVVVGDLLLRHSRYLRQVYYIGGNERAARLSGIPVDSVRLVTYIVSSLLAAVAGILLASRLGSASPLAGQQLELRVIAATVIGGASLAGGEGTIAGAFLGVLLMAFISNGLTMMHVSPYWADTVTGGILVAAVALDMLLRRKRVG
jgi:ribose transport system permease protein